MFFKKKKKENTKTFRRDMAKKLDGRAIKYVTKRMDDGNESVIGRNGALIVKGDELLVYSSSNVVMRLMIDEMNASELLSLEGVILQGENMENENRDETIIAYYTHYI